MKLTVEQIAAMAPKAVQIRLHDSVHDVHFVDIRAGIVGYTDSDNDAWEVTFNDLTEHDIVFYTLTEMPIPAALATQEQASEDRDAQRDLRDALVLVIEAWEDEDQERLQCAMEYAVQVRERTAELPTFCDTGDCNDRDT
jgi:hypothetical protein